MANTPDPTSADDTASPSLTAGASAPQALGVIKMFRHHGVWAVGIHMFRNMAFVSKAMVIFAIFMCVVAQLLFIFVRASNLSIHAAERELVGISQVREIAVLLDEAQSLRGSILAAGGKHTPAVIQQLDQIEAHLAKTEALLAVDPALAEASKFVRNAFTPNRTASSDREEAYTRADEFVQHQPIHQPHHGRRDHQPGGDRSGTRWVR